MPRKIDSLKVSVQPGAPDNKKAPKRTIKKRTVAKKQINLSKEASSRHGSDARVMTLLFSVIATAVVVGVIISVVQKASSSREIKEVKKETESVKSEFQNRLEELKSKLQGTESENEELKSKEEKLQQIVSNAKAEYNNEELGISFSYPAVYGEVLINYEEGGSGKLFYGTFSDFNDLVFGGVSPDYTTSRELALTDTQGYRQRGGKYYYKSLGEDPVVYEVEVFKVLDAENTEIPVIDKENFLVPDDVGPSFEEVVAKAEGEEADVAEEKNKLLALINLEGDEFAGLAFLNNNTESVSLSDFEDILTSISVSQPVISSNETAE